MSDVVIDVQGISKSYQLGTAPRPKMLRDRLSQLWRGQSRRARRDELFWALRDVSFEINRGDVVGIIGRNGAGKSTLLKVLSRITEPTLGKAKVRGRIGSLLEVGTGFHPELSGRENVFLNGAILGLQKSEIHKQFDQIVAFAEVEKFIDTPVKHYSSGMYLRLAFAVAAHLDTDILFVDEVLAVGDINFQQKCLGKMNDVARQGRTVLFVSHNMSAGRNLCSKGILLEGGKVSQVGKINASIQRYMQTSVKPGGSDSPIASGFIEPVLVNRDHSPTVDQGDGLTITSLFRVPEECDGMYVFVVMEDMIGQTVFHLRQDMGRTVINNRTEIRLCVAIPPLWLNPGLYSVYLKILPWSTAGRNRYVSEKVSIDVVGHGSNVQCLLNPAVEWSVQ